MNRRRTLFMVLCGVILCGAARIAAAEDLVWATGRVYAADGRRPLAGAMVAVYDSKNRVVDYARTDANGDYALAVPRSALNLNVRRGGGFLYQVTSGVSRFVGGVGKAASWPLKAGIRVAENSTGAADPLTKIGVGAAAGMARDVVDGLSSDRRKKEVTARALPGALLMKVSLPGHNDALSVARVYWVQEEIVRAGGREQRALTAWFDPARLTPAHDANPSAIASDYLTFTDIRLEPSIAERGQTVAVTVTFPLPAEPRTPVVIVARNARNGQTVPLLPIGENRYRGEFKVDRRFPPHDQAICVLAYAQQDDQPGQNKKAEDALLRAGFWNPEKPFTPNPLLVVSRNRAEAILTVVEPSPRRLSPVR